MLVTHRANVYPKSDLGLDNWAEQGLQYWVEYDYYPLEVAGTTADNPSGNPNLKAERYIFDSAGTAEAPVLPIDKYTKTYIYNSSDDVIKEYITV